MAIAPNYHESHLLVAAIRVLSHLEGRPPTPVDIAGLLKLSSEKVHVLVHELRARGVLQVTETPFEIRVDVADPTPLESLSREDSGPQMRGELEEFYSREVEKKEAMERMFRGGEAEKKRRERVARLEEEFRKFKPKGGGPGSPFEQTPEEGDEA